MNDMNLWRAEKARTGNYGNDYYYGEDEVVRCEVCGKETDTLYMDKDGYIFGCDHCVQRRYADEVTSDARWV